MSGNRIFTLFPSAFVLALLIAGCSDDVVSFEPGDTDHTDAGETDAAGDTGDGNDTEEPGDTGDGNDTEEPDDTEDTEELNACGGTSELSHEPDSVCGPCDAQRWVCDGLDDVICDDEPHCPECGDGLVEDGEACDDGNTAEGDGCSSECRFEPGWACEGDPLVCESICGDGLIVASEACDDGNTAEGDGCSSSCEVEVDWTCEGEPSVCEDLLCLCNKTAACEELCPCDLDCSVGENLIPSGADWVAIEVGTFLMGTAQGEPVGSLPETQHQVTLTRDFEMMRTPVTQGQWETLMGGNPSHFSACGADCPVEFVNWYEALEFANVLSELAGFEPCYSMTTCYGELGGVILYNCDVEVTGDGNPYDCEGYRLPTEAEWEYAARAGETGVRYGEVDDIAWWNDNSGGQPRPVATKEANAWGLYDMLGNVWNWTWDFSRLDLGSEALVDPTGPVEGERRMLRGGGWSSNALAMRFAHRFHYFPYDRFSICGFRLVRTLP